MAKRVLLSKSQVIDAIADASGETKVTAGKVMATHAQVITEAFIKDPPKGDEVVAIPLIDLGVIGVKNVPEKKMLNNITGKEQTIPAHRAVSVRMSKNFKAALNPDQVEKLEKAKAEKKGAKGA